MGITVRRIVATVVVVLTVGGLSAALPGVASADPGTEWTGGYQGAGMVTQRRDGGRECGGGQAILVVHTDDPEVANGAQRGDSKPGMGWVCVSAAGYQWAHIGRWWPGKPNGPRG